MLSRMTRKQIIELLETVREGIVCPNMNERAAMLDECIAALSISQNICKKELVAERFAQYKDTMDTMTAALGQMKESPAEEITALSLQLLDWLLGELKNEKVKKEIVFLPYKASMWDSLESIWRAAAEDSEHCNAYVVPIPYADLTKEHTVKEWHCEIELFPKDVPVLDFRQVDLEKMHPDVIFIHNPYDYANYVTSVDSHYYSSELKKYTDKLVYVPYFVIGNNLPPHFAQAPGVVNADYVIVESEEIKEQYERYYPGGNPPEGKFLALGSPKFDKVLGARREDYELPEKWKKLLNGRKAILYNTGVTAVLQNRETYLKKVRSVFETFKQRDDVVLWWRPHPLLEATFDSMVPEQAEEYRQLREEYIQAGWGIYDDSPELERAITWTDAYYGDQSSVVWMYQATGKPILLQQEAGQKLSVLNVCVDPDAIYFYEGCHNVICSINRKTRLLNSKISVPSIFRVQENSFGALCKVGEKIILLPLCSTKFVEYNLITQQFQEVFVTHNEYGIDKAGWFQYCVSYRHFRYFISTRNSEIIKYNVDTGEYSRITQWYQLLKPYINPPVPLQSEFDTTIFCMTVKNKMLLAVPLLNGIIEVDMDSDLAELKRIGDVTHRYQSLYYENGYYWLLDRGKKAIVRYDESVGDVTEYDAHLSLLARAPAEFVFNSICVSNDKIYLFPHAFSHKVIMDAESGVVLALCDSSYAVTVEQVIGNTWAQIDVNGDRIIVYIKKCDEDQEGYEIKYEEIKNDVSIQQSGHRVIWHEPVMKIDDFLDVYSEIYDEKKKNGCLLGRMIYLFSVDNMGELCFLEKK